MSACPSAPYQPKSGKGLFNFLYSSISGARQYIISSTIRLLGKCILFGTRHFLPEMTVWFESPGIRENNQSGKRIQDFQWPGHQTWSLSDRLVPGSGGKHLMKCRISVAAEEAPVIWIEGSPWGKRRKSSKPRNDLGQRKNYKPQSTSCNASHWLPVSYLNSAKFLFKEYVGIMPVPV